MIATLLSFGTHQGSKFPSRKRYEGRSAANCPEGRFYEDKIESESSHFVLKEGYIRTKLSKILIPPDFCGRRIAFCSAPQKNKTAAQLFLRFPFPFQKSLPFSLLDFSRLQQPSKRAFKGRLAQIERVANVIGAAFVGKRHHAPETGQIR